MPKTLSVSVIYTLNILNSKNNIYMCVGVCVCVLNLCVFLYYIAVHILIGEY